MEVYMPIDPKGSFLFNDAHLSFASELLKRWEVIDFDQKYVDNLNSRLFEILQLKSTSFRTQLSKIIEAFNNESLVLVLGAGVSVDYNLPNWDTLLQKLLLSSFQNETDSNKEKSLVLAKIFTKIFSPNPLIAARYLRNYYRENSKDGEVNAFEKAIRNSLYENFKSNFCSLLYREIVQLCVSPGKTPNLNSILTYNYDDILETHIKELDITIPYKTIAAVGIKPASGEL
ncbi:MAG: hypothetical protein EHM14_15920, partial [Methanothrix sp.]